MFSKFLAAQLSRPSSLIGPLLLGPLWNRRNQALNECALRLLALEADDEVLEIGFGGGYLLAQVLKTVSRGLVAGIDVSAAMTDSGHRRFRREERSGRLELKNASVAAIPYPAERFGKVFSVNSLFYWPDVAQGIQECSRVLRVSGRLVLVFTRRESLEDRSFAQHGLALPETAEVGQMMMAAGLRVNSIYECSDHHRAYWGVVGTKTGRLEADAASHDAGPKPTIA